MRGEVALVEEAPIEGKPDLPAVAPIEGEVLGAEDSPIAAGAKASGASLPARTVTAALPWMRNWRTREVCHVEREEGGECQVYYPALNLRARVRSDELRSLSAESLTAVMARFGP
jgi:hypothetical protein